ncbi:MAG: hypothetical protein AAF557_19210 [Pseudomonadota bacterium]
MALTLLSTTRVGDGPIIHKDMGVDVGANINGPCMIRVPDWAYGLGKYHLYFAHHRGDGIRLAYADEIEGPWTIHPAGALALSASHFPTELPTPEVLPDWMQVAGEDLYPHIASPDVHVDHKAKRILMYFHGMLPGGDQQTRLAISTDGVRFDAVEPLLGKSYFRAFRYGGWIYTLPHGGRMFRAQDWVGPFAAGPQLIPFEVVQGHGIGMRHAEVHVIEHVLHILFTRMGDCPEAILHCTVDLSANWHDWRVSEPALVLQPELTWEGAELPLQPSRMGAVDGLARQLRDPCLFVEDGQAWLLYAGGGESAIGLARLDGLLD